MTRGRKRELKKVIASEIQAQWNSFDWKNGRIIYDTDFDQVDVEYMEGIVDAIICKLNT